MNLNPLCPHCGQPWPDYPVAPAGCQCDPQDWNNPKAIPPVCKSFIPFSLDEHDLCGRCQHLLECHTETSR